MENKEVYDKIDKCISEQLGENVEDIKPYSHLKDDLRMDSLDDVELVMLLEEEFDIDISDEEAEKCKLVKDIYIGILGKLGIVPLSDLELVSDTDCKPEITKTLIPSETTKEALMEVKDCTFTSSDIFQQMLTLAKQNDMFIQFDGFTQDENDTIVVTKQGSDTEYVIETQEQFNQLVESFNVLREV
uniref:Carrier domain-containing protein n=1 Tax=Vibrio phage P018-4 TaxID=3229728 RepID=A0AB39AJK2_9CAUD